MSCMREKIKRARCTTQIDDLRKWFPNVKEAEWMRLKALDANGRRGRTPINKAYDLAERQVFGKLRSSGDHIKKQL